MTKIGTLSVAVVLTAAFAVIGMRCERQAQFARVQQQRREARLVQQRAELREVMRAITLAEKQRAVLREVPGTAPQTKKSSSRPRWKAPDFHAVLRQHPELQTLQTEVQQGLIRTKYEPLFRQLKLSEEKIARFAALMAGQDERRLDALAALQSQHLTRESDEGQKIFRELWTQYRDAQRELLGNDGVAAFDEYERTALVRETASSFAGASTVRGTPMTSDQLEQLTQAMSSASASYRSGRMAMPAEIDWASVFNQTSGVLSEAQLATVREIEPHGATSFGGRRLLLLQAAIRQAAEADNAANLATTTAHDAPH